VTAPGQSEEVPPTLAGERLDRFIALLTGCSRSEATDLVRGGGVTVSGHEVRKGSHRLESGDVVALSQDPHQEDPLPSADPSVDFQVVHEDDQVIVVDKPAGLVVHPGPGHKGGTLVDGLLARFPEIAGVGQPERPGLVHRLDRGTSGLLVVARTPEAHAHLVDQMATHAAQRRYAALVFRHPEHSHGVIDAPVGRSRRDPLRMTVAMDGRNARTHYEVETTFDEPVEATLLRCDLETGRTHQIRVHLASIGHPVVGDPLYGGRRLSLRMDRPFLHAARLSFAHPGTDEIVAFTSALPEDLTAVLSGLS